MARTDSLRYSLAELEAMATIPWIESDGGRTRRMGCGFHGSDHQRSLKVNLETGQFRCYACGAWRYLSDGFRERGPHRSHIVPRGGRPRGLGNPQKRRQKVPEWPGRDPLHHKARQLHPEAGKGSQAVPPRLGWYMEAARRHLGDPPSAAYLEARNVTLDLARSVGLGYFPVGKWPGRWDSRRWGGITFPLETPAGLLVGLYSRAIDPHYLQQKVAKEVRHDIWGKWVGTAYV